MAVDRLEESPGEIQYSFQSERLENLFQSVTVGHRWF